MSQIPCELAKRLKDAGFPQKHDYRGGYEYPYCVKCYGGDSEYDRAEKPCTPSLSELIEACGDGFENLERTFVYATAEDPGAKWQAYMSDSEFDKSGISCVRDCCGYFFGETPEIAVASLYLALHETK